ncbi:MAG TPA: PBP1A family penicillin-binding protein [Gemmatimonadaceae bacterium]|nr:PBP1A family penicillin-binding protein [Gemmatimonadaceae bacterium]
MVARHLTRALGIVCGVATLAYGQNASEPWRIIAMPQSSIVYARDGSVLGEIGTQWRSSVPLRTLPKYVAQAFIAVEDHRFYEHDGVDLIGVAGAVKDIVRGQPRGASTITQQLVGNMHPTIIDRTDRSPMRKLREQAAAREMEKHYNKEQILEAYLNLISFGRRYYGVDAASRYYFGKPAARLTLAEAATLAAMPKGPALYDPIRHPARTKQRRDLVLTLMAQQGLITAQQAEAAKREGLKTSPPVMIDQAPYFLDVVKTQVERQGLPLGTAGLKVYTTLDPVLQRSARSALMSVTAEFEKRPGYRHPTLAKHAAGNVNYLQGAVVAMEPFSGEVRALIGGRDYTESAFNRAVNGMRQPGSSFKPFVYASALEHGWAPNAIVADTALAIPLPNRTIYKPKNSDGEFKGLMSLRDALAFSRNPVAVQLGLSLQMDTVIALAQRLGIDSPIAPYPSSAIGASVVQPLDLVTAYASFANLGLRVDPRFILRVEDASQRVVWQPPPPTWEQVLHPAVAFIVRDMLRDVVQRGTAMVVRQFLPDSIPVAGKTGTTDNNTDVWFVGMTPEIVAGVWLGFDKPTRITAAAAGGTLAAPIFGRMLQTVYADRAAAPWLAPEGVVPVLFDRATGSAATPATPLESLYTEYFLEGTEPEPLRTWRRALRASSQFTF